MRIIFFGSSSFSVPVLQSLSRNVACVVTKKAKPKGRGYGLEDNEIKKASLEIGLPLLEIDSFKGEEAQRLKEIEADIFVVASFGLIMPAWSLDLPIIGPLNVHPSLLPKYRGASPIQGVLLNREKETGITFIRMNEKMDAGDVLYQERIPMSDDDNIITLSERLSHRVAEILPGFVERIWREGKMTGIPQNSQEATYTPIITKEMAKVNWSEGTEKIMGKIKAFSGWPVAYAILDNKQLKLFDAHKINNMNVVCDKRAIPGTICHISRNGITVATTDGYIILTEVQLESKKRMKAYDFSVGYKDLAKKILA